MRERRVAGDSPTVASFRSDVYLLTLDPISQLSTTFHATTVDLVSGQEVAPDDTFEDRIALVHRADLHRTTAAMRWKDAIVQHG